MLDRISRVYRPQVISLTAVCVAPVWCISYVDFSAVCGSSDLQEPDKCLAKAPEARRLVSALILFRCREGKALFEILPVRLKVFLQRLISQDLLAPERNTPTAIRPRKTVCEMPIFSSSAVTSFFILSIFSRSSGVSSLNAAASYSSRVW